MIYEPSASVLRSVGGILKARSQPEPEMTSAERTELKASLENKPITYGILFKHAEGTNEVLREAFDELRREGDAIALRLQAIEAKLAGLGL